MPEIRATRTLSPLGPILILFPQGQMENPIAVLEERAVREIMGEWFNRTVDGEDKVRYPFWFEIIRQCQIIMHHNATVKRKGNSWLEMKPHDKFWNTKLKEEVKEAMEANTPGEEVNEMKELCDVINVCAMRIDLLRTKLKAEKRA